MLRRAMGSYRQSLQLVCLACISALLALSLPCRAAEDDAMQQLLQDKGLLPAPAQKLVGQVRDTASSLVISAMNFIGVRYRRGGESVEQGFDCSGFTRHVFETSLGLLLPRRADQQARDKALSKVARADLQPGDLVFFNTMRRAFSHVGIYIGDGKFIHAPRSGSEVRVEDMHQAYWARRFNGARRAELAAAAPEAIPAQH
jgi:cell wall-associated NlpC family hydrolase